MNEYLKRVLLHSVRLIQNRLWVLYSSLYQSFFETAFQMLSLTGHHLRVSLRRTNFKLSLVPACAEFYKVNYPPLHCYGFCPTATLSPSNICSFQKSLSSALFPSFGIANITALFSFCKLYLPIFLTKNSGCILLLLHRIFPFRSDPYNLLILLFWPFINRNCTAGLSVHNACRNRRQFSAQLYICISGNRLMATTFNHQLRISIFF